MKRMLLSVILSSCTAATMIAMHDQSEQSKLATQLIDAIKSTPIDATKPTLQFPDTAMAIEKALALIQRERDLDSKVLHSSEPPAFATNDFDDTFVAILTKFDLWSYPNALDKAKAFFSTMQEMNMHKKLLVGQFINRGYTTAGAQSAILRILEEKDAREKAIASNPSQEQSPLESVKELRKQGFTPRTIERITQELFKIANSSGIDKTKELFSKED